MSEAERQPGTSRLQSRLLFRGIPRWHWTSPRIAPGRALGALDDIGTLEVGKRPAVTIVILSSMVKPGTCAGRQPDLESKRLGHVLEQPHARLLYSDSA